MIPSEDFVGSTESGHEYGVWIDSESDSYKADISYWRDDGYFLHSGEMTVKTLFKTGIEGLIKDAIEDRLGKIRWHSGRVRSM